VSPHITNLPKVSEEKLIINFGPNLLNLYAIFVPNFIAPVQSNGQDCLKAQSQQILDFIL
jgi:hypothetical protein